jgi:hypothetical protein
MLLLDGAIFLHVPKTGGTWVEHALVAAGVPCSQYDVDGDRHADLSYLPRQDVSTFAFVRHPLTLHQSYWRFKMGAGWDARNPFDLDVQTDHFERFVENTLRRHPGWVSQMYEDYVGPPEREISFIGRFECLADDLVRALTTFGIPFDESRLRGTPPINASPGWFSESVWNPGLACAVAAAESRAMTRFGYTLEQ